MHPCMTYRYASSGRESSVYRTYSHSEIWRLAGGNAAITLQLLDANKVEITGRGEYGETVLLSYLHEMGPDKINAEVVQHLVLEKKADVNICDDDGMTALMYCAQKGHANLCKLLVEESADMYAKNHGGGHNALILAAGFGHLPVIRVLLEDAKMDVNVQNNYGCTALMWSIARHYVSPKQLEIVKYLCEAGTDMTLLTEFDYGETVYDIAIRRRHKGVEQFLDMFVQGIRTAWEDERLLLVNSAIECSFDDADCGSMEWSFEPALIAIICQFASSPSFLEVAAWRRQNPPRLTDRREVSPQQPVAFEEA